MSLSSWERGREFPVHESSDSKVVALISAARANTALRVRYTKPYGNGTEERTITPSEVFRKTGETDLYVRAHCHTRDAIRVFMVRRLTILGSAVEPGPVSREKVVAGGASYHSRRVECVVEYIELEGDYGNDVPSVEATCTRCGHVTQSYGDSSASVGRCLALMKEECPLGESNWYVEE